MVAHANERCVASSNGSPLQGNLNVGPFRSVIDSIANDILHGTAKEFFVT